MKYWVLLLILCVSCSNPIEQALDSKNERIKNVVNNIDKHEVQIIFTQIDTSDTGEVLFDDYTYNLNADNYFYPASTVKLPIAVLAAEYMDLNKNLTIDVPYISQRDDDTHTVSDDISQIFAVSDNEAYNRLYEILGRDYINSRLRKKGFDLTRISHRLSTSNADAGERSNVKLFPSYEGEVISLEDKKDTKITKLSINKIAKGKGYIKDGTLVNEAMDFSEKNYFPLEEQHNLMKRLVFPENFSEAERFDITEETRIRLLSAMKTLPRNAKYDPKTYYDSYVKFFLYGDTKEPIPNTVSIYNKVGYAYGTLTETAYIVDTQHKVRFLLSATILVNENGIFNDDTYEYEKIGIPFLAQLGRELYDQEKARND